MKSPGRVSGGISNGWVQRLALFLHPEKLALPYARGDGPSRCNPNLPTALAGGGVLPRVDAGADAGRVDGAMRSGRYMHVFRPKFALPGLEYANIGLTPSGTPDQVHKLFTDPIYAKSQLLGDKQLHQVFRDILNTNIPATQADAIKAGLVQLPWYQSIYHNPWYNPWEDSKFIAPDGHLEAVYDRNENPVTGNDYKGTFNFYAPSQFWDHKGADVDPYNKWGN